MKMPAISITMRTALLSWAVSLVTLMAFVAVILPWQQNTFQANLESKAHGVAVSLRDVAAGAAVNEDYSSVIEHCKEMLAGDTSLAYLVITKNDGFSLIQDREGWRSENDAGLEWRPVKRVATGGIGFVPLFQKRVYYYSQPFDYSGIQWGWIHVGLTLDAYEQSLTNLYRLAALLGISCAGLSLLASALYARRLVRPVLDLQGIVRRVAAGDLTAHATAARTDELGQLAISVNSMTGALLRRDEILGSMQFAAQRFLAAGDWQEVIEEVLARIGQAAGVCRVHVFKKTSDPAGGTMLSFLHEWTAPGVAPKCGDPALQHVSGADPTFAPWFRMLQRREIISARLSEQTGQNRALFLAQNIRSLLMVPVIIEGEWWGVVGLSDCGHDRIWSEAELDSVQAVADMLGAAIARQRTQDALLEAKATLEQRVEERTRDLQRENLERKEAEAALARSLSVINATLESTVDGILVLDMNGDVKHFNRRFAEMWGLDPTYLASGRKRHILRSVAKLLKDPRTFIKSWLRLHFDSGSEVFQVLEFHDGRIFELFTRPQDFDGVSTGRVWSCRDITDRKRAEAEVTYERDLLQTLLDSIPDTLYFKDLESRFQRVSRSKVESSLQFLRERHRRESPGEAPETWPPHLQDLPAMRQWLQGRTDADVYDAKAALLLLEEEQKIIRTGEPINSKIECLHRRDGGEKTWYLVTKLPWFDKEGRIIGTYGISKDITAIKEAEEKLTAIHEELIQASRLAGMAEVATGVLHNVGNVLNSVNVSATLMREALLKSEVATLVRVADLLRNRTDDIGAYLSTDPKGRLVPGFVIQLADQLAKEQTVLVTEHAQLARSVEHIKEIVAMQQDYARVSGVLEKFQITDLLADALQINMAGLSRHGVQVVRDYAPVPLVTIDKHKVMQILVNLINNANYAVDAMERTDRQIRVSVGPSDDNHIRVTVADNGIGIAAENLTRVFSRGFTTRQNGHGFGLHSGANAAREMGGSLRAESPGPGHGATFILELPIIAERNNP